VLRAPRRIIIAVVAVVVLVSGAALGHHLLGRTMAASSASVATPSRSDAGQGPAATPTTGVLNGATRNGAAGSAGPARPAGPATSSGAARAPGATGTLPKVPVFAVAPQIVRTATLDLRLDKRTLSSSLTNIAALAAADGGYVDSSSMGGGTARTSPVSGSIVIRVLDTDFSAAMTALSGYGKVTNQQIQGKDVTNRVSTNAATIQILQDEVTLLQGKLAQATDINTFLQIQNQLFPVEEQLQQLENQQTVLENSAAFSTITANLSAPGAPLVTTPPSRPNADSAVVAWRYLRHNSLAVLDGLAVGGGWALPVVVLLALLWLAGSRRVRRRRQAINAA
jgi:Domain of unknown function (DUF4349)